ncbi:hypothetical protein [Flavihumibacter fluvii]|uniref:hypothetical protein n=1 Tax=Flavihumibacter fluvii TaxID=2838157 RepID=UPI001BDE95EE|nr:hypothetical protein [Flavihumibacter fluvii]ULQ52174.1 hypothetical protein KJS93_18955 [Flavihumibacter fluvii]
MQLLQSPSQQALVLERNGVVVGQFDIIRQRTHSDGLFINYNFPDEPYSPQYWLVGVTQLVRILTREVPREYIYIEIPSNYFTLIGHVEQIGFVRVQQNQKEMYFYKFMGNSG